MHATHLDDSVVLLVPEVIDEIEVAEARPRLYLSPTKGWDRNVLQVALERDPAFAPVSFLFLFFCRRPPWGRTRASNKGGRHTRESDGEKRKSANESQEKKGRGDNYCEEK